MVTQLTQFADSSSGLGSLGIDGKAFIIQLVTFVLAYLVLRHWAFGPILKIMRERRNTIENGVKLGEKMKQEEAEAEVKIEKKLHEARAKADEILAGARDTSKQMVADAENDARAKAQGILDAAGERIEQETTQARRQLEKELVGLVSEVTGAVLEEKVDAKKDAALIERALKEVKA